MDNMYTKSGESPDLPTKAKNDMTEDQNIELQNAIDNEQAQEAKEHEFRNTIHLATRVSPEVGAQLIAISKKYGTSIFFILRMFADCLIRLSDDRHNLSEDLMRIIRQFENIPGWSKSICLADDTQEFGIVEAIYILRAPGKEGYRLCLVERPMMDGDANGWLVTYNVQRILERFIEVMNPSLYRHLRLLAVELGTESMLDTIQRIADEYMENPDEVELRLQFEGNDWHKGAQMTDRTRYKRPYTKSEEYLQKTLFDNEDENN